MLLWIENTAIAQWVGLSYWAYPFLLCLHITGLAIVVGIFFMRDLRVLGLARELDARIFLTLNRLAWAGFVLNLVSGLLLFSSQATIFVQSTPFLVKITCIAAAMVLAAWQQSRLRRELAANGGISLALKSTAACSLTLWVAAISAGRLIAYL